MFKPCRPSIDQSAYLEIAALSRPLYLMSLGHGAAEQCAIYRKGCVTFKRQKTDQNAVEKNLAWICDSLPLSC